LACLFEVFACIEEAMAYCHGTIVFDDYFDYLHDAGEDGIDCFGEGWGRSGVTD
jgi:hypothetical protein